MNNPEMEAYANHLYAAPAKACHVSVDKFMTLPLLKKAECERAVPHVAIDPVPSSSSMLVIPPVVPSASNIPLTPLTVLIYYWKWILLAFIALRYGPRLRRSPLWQRAKSSLHGSADWMHPQQAQKLFEQGGIILGELPNSQLLRYDGLTNSGHCLVISGSGGYKTSGTVIPCCLEWPDGLVCLDPSGEASRLTRAARREMGHRVMILDPEVPTSDTFNALDWIDITSSFALSDIQSVISWMAGEAADDRGGEGDYFLSSARDLLSCLLADIMFDPTIAPADKTLALLRRRVALPTTALKKLLTAIYAKGDDYGFGYPAQMAGTLKDINPRQFDGFAGTATNRTAWLAQPALARLVCGSGFNTQYLLKGKVDIFLNLPLEILRSTPEVGRVIVGSLLSRIYKAKGAVTGRLLFLLDEAAVLGRMATLQTARDTSRKYLVSLVLLYQSIGQLHQIWGKPGTKSWLDMSYIRSFAHISDNETAEEVSRSCGQFTAVATSWGESRTSGNRRSRSSNASSSSHQVGRRLILPGEVQELPDDEQIILIQGQPPLRCRKAIYFQRSEMLARTGGYTLAAAR